MERERMQPDPTNVRPAFDATAFSDSLSFDNATGIWRARHAAAVSYPEDGHAACFQLEDSSFWFRHRNRCVAAAVRRWPPAGVILDVGGGNGYVAGGLIAAGYPAALLEPGDEGARNAHMTRHIPDVICATLESAAIKPDTIPAVGLFDVLEHIEDDAGFAGELRRILVPGGLIYVTVPAYRWLWSITDVEAGHYRRYSTRRLVSRFTSAGFQVLYQTYFFEVLVAPFFLMRTLPFQLGLTRPRDISQYRTEHAAGGGWMANLVQSLLAREVPAIEKGRRLATGTSCLLVARKP
jgi:SAM-dependent methyltransferase